MKIGFTVGENEQHQLELSFDEGSVDIRILVDGAPVIEDTAAHDHEPVRYELNVGKGERHGLAMQVTYGEVRGGLGIHTAPRVSLKILPTAA